MKAPPFAYHAPRSLAEVFPLLAALENAKLLAGGQSLMPMLNMRYVVPDHLVDLNGVAELRGIRDTGRAFEIGAMVRQSELEQSAAVRSKCPIFAAALQFVGHFQTRSRGTLGGSLCHLDAAAELPLLALVYDATLRVVSAAGPRDVPAGDWALGFMTPNLRVDELLARISVPYWMGTHGHGFAEYARRHGDFAIVAVAALVQLDGRGRIARLACAIGGLQATPFRAADLERALIGNVPAAALIAQARHSVSELEAMSDAYVPATYRKRLAGALVERALREALERAGSGLPEVSTLRRQQ